MDDSTDILGGQLNVAHQSSLFSWFGLTFTNLLSATMVVLAIFYGLQLLYPHYRQYQERRYRKFLRRRHGIPDNDNRPFNVAYAAAKKALKEREAAAKGLSRRNNAPIPVIGGPAARQHVSVAPGPAASQSQATILAQPLQCRDTEGAQQPRSGYIETRPASGQTTTANESNHHLTGMPQDRHNEKLMAAGSSSSLYTPAFTRSAVPETTHGKRTLDDRDLDADEQQEPKKSRLDTGDGKGKDKDVGVQRAEADIIDHMEVDEASPAQPKRGAKRLASVEEDEGFESARAIGRGKRARKASSQDPILKAMRGKKRDRAEAGSTVGGDDFAEDDIEDKHRSQRRRRIGNKKSVGNLRGQKRAREHDSSESDNESDSTSRRSARNKRGKRSPREEDWTSDDGLVSHDPLCNGRPIGEEWESNGVLYKVGPNGQRLRQALVKKSRSRFPMPKDSEHPDRQANVDVYVETWLSEEQYQLAKDRNELAWQSPRNSVVDLPALTEVPESPSKGKNLLWSSTAQKDMRKFPLAKFSTPSGNLRSIHQSQNALVRRVSTIFAPAPTVPESPKLKPSRSYSKWEKQDLEAAAMAKLREKVKHDSVPAVPAKKTVTFAVPSTSTSTPPTTFEASTSSNKPMDSATPKASDPPKVPTLSFGNVADSAPAQPAKASTSDLPSLTIPSNTAKPSETSKQPVFPFPSGPSASTEPVKIPAAVPPTSTPFSLNNLPASQPAVGTASTQSNSASAPNLFGKPTASAASSAPKPFGNTFGVNVTATTPGIFGSTTQTTSTLPAPSSQSSLGAPIQPTTTSFLAFGSSAPDATKNLEEKPGQTSTSSEPSLLSRMGGFGIGTATSSAGGSAPPSGNAGSQHIFSFTKPAPPAASSIPTTSSSSTAAGSSAPLKFNFGVTSKPAATPATATPNVPVGAETDMPKPATTPVFGVSGTPAAPVSTSTETPKSFGFGTQPSAFDNGSSSHTVFGTVGGSSAFGATSSAPKEAPVTPNAKSAFVFPRTPTNNSVFGTTSTTPSGTPSGSMFGNANPAPSTPVNGSTFAETTSTTPVSKPQTGSAFGNTAATTTPAGPPPAKSMFDFSTPVGSGTSGAGIFGNFAKPAGTSSVFGQPSSAPSSQPVASDASSSKSSSSFTAPQTTSESTTGSSSTAPVLNAPKFTFTFGSSNPTTLNPTSTTAASTSSGTQAKNLFMFGSGPATTGATPVFGSTTFGSTNTGSASGTSQPAPSTFTFGATSVFGQSKPPESGEK